MTMWPASSFIPPRPSAWVQFLLCPARASDFPIKEELCRTIIVPQSSIIFGAICLALLGVAYSLIQNNLWNATALGSAAAISVYIRLRLLTSAMREPGNAHWQMGVVVSALGYAATIGGFGLLCALSDRVVLMVLSGMLVTGMAFGSTFAAAGAPRLSRVQVLLIIAPFLIGLIFSQKPYMWIVFVQTPLWVFGIFMINSTIHIQLADLIQAQRMNRYLAYNDALTGLSNRARIMAKLKSDVTKSPDADCMHYILYLDLDGFKFVNDTHGHAAGDELLSQVARRLTSAVRPIDEVGRMGGDEFIIILHDLNMADIAHVSKRLIADISERYLLPCGSEVRIGVSIGGAPLIGDPANSIAFADKNLYGAKTAGKGTYRLAAP